MFMLHVVHGSDLNHAVPMWYSCYNLFFVHGSDLNHTRTSVIFMPHVVHSCDLTYVIFMLRVVDGSDLKHTVQDTIHATCCSREWWPKPHTVPTWYICMLRVVHGSDLKHTVQDDNMHAAVATVHAQWSVKMAESRVTKRNEGSSRGHCSLFVCFIA